MSDDRLTVQSAVELLKREGSRLAERVPVEGLPPMTYDCDLASDGARPEEFTSLPYKCPPDLNEFWSIARTAKLFEDREYGQWGLEIPTPQRAVAMTSLWRAERGRDFITGDLVIGKFLGDSDLLIIRCDESEGDYGRVLVALPMDSRSDWPNVAESFADFLDKYVRSGGEKYWEGQAGDETGRDETGR